jgi:parvulin-like peptidyl-prolyl isomerase
MNRLTLLPLFVLSPIVLFQFGVLWLNKPTPVAAVTQACPEPEAPATACPSEVAAIPAPLPAAQPVSLPVTPGILGAIGQQIVTIAEIEAELRNLPSYLHFELRSDGKLRAYVDEILTKKSMMAEAERLGITTDPKLNKEVEEYRTRKITDQYLSAYMRKEQVVVPLERIREYYDTHAEEFAAKDLVHVRHIFIKMKPGQVAATQAKAERIATRARRGEDFEDLARGESDDAATAARGGDLGILPRGRHVKALEDAAFQLVKPGEIAGPIETQSGFHVLQLVKRSTQPAIPFERAREQITYRLLPDRQREAHQELLDDLRRKYPRQLREESFEVLREALRNPARTP